LNKREETRMDALYNVFDNVRIAHASVEPVVPGSLHRILPSGGMRDPVILPRFHRRPRAIIAASVLVWYMFSRKPYGWQAVEWGEFVSACSKFQNKTGFLNIRQAMYGVVNLYRTGYVDLLVYNYKIWVLPTEKLAHVVKRA